MAQMTALRRRMIDDMTVRNLSPATQQSYVERAIDTGLQEPVGEAPAPDRANRRARRKLWRENAVHCGRTDELGAAG